MRVKDYLSYSQYKTYSTSKQAYIDIYLNGKRLDNKYLTFGKDFADDLEKEKMTIEMAEVYSKLPQVDEREKEFLLNFQGIPLLGKLDGFSRYRKHLVIIDEYKTGKKPWTQKMVDEAEQLTIYALLVHGNLKVEYKNIVIRLHWAETCEDVDGKIFFTGRVESFTTSRSQRDILKIYPKLKKAWLGIEELINNYIK